MPLIEHTYATLLKESFETTVVAREKVDLREVKRERNIFFCGAKLVVCARVCVRLAMNVVSHF